MSEVQEKEQEIEIPIYTDIHEAIEQGIFEKSSILVLWGKRGHGKSSLMAKFCVDFMQPDYAEEDVEDSKAICELLNEAGISLIRPPEDHLVFVDTFVESKGAGLVNTKAYQFDLNTLGLPTEDNKPMPVIPCSKIALDEIQDVLDSHEGALPTNISKWFELSRHVELFIILVLQRPMRLPKDIRDLATFVECVDVHDVRNEYGLFLGTVWDCNIIYDNANLELYLKLRDKSNIDKKVNFSEDRGNIFDCYDHHYFLPAFYQDMENQMPVLDRCERVEFTQDSFKRYYEHHKLPENWGKKDNKKKKKVKEELNNAGDG